MYESTIRGFGILPLRGECEVSKSVFQRQQTEGKLRSALIEREGVLRSMLDAGNIEKAREYARRHFWKIQKLADEILTEWYR